MSGDSQNSARQSLGQPVLALKLPLLGAGGWARRPTGFFFFFCDFIMLNILYSSNISVI